MKKLAILVGGLLLCTLLISSPAMADPLMTIDEATRTVSFNSDSNLTGNGSFSGETATFTLSYTGTVNPTGVHVVFIQEPGSMLVSDEFWMIFSQSGSTVNATGSFYSLPNLPPPPPAVGIWYIYENTGGFATQDFGNITALDVDINSPVPEPGTLLLFGSSLIGLVGFKRKFNA